MVLLVVGGVVQPAGVGIAVQSGVQPGAVGFVVQSGGGAHVPSKMQSSLLFRPDALPPLNVTISTLLFMVVLLSTFKVVFRPSALDATPIAKEDVLLGTKRTLA